MFRARALGVALAVAVAAAIITAAPAWADDSPPPADPAPAPTPRTAADVPPLVSEPLTVPLGGPEPPPFEVTGPLDPSTQNIHVVVPHSPLDLPHDFVFPVLSGVGTGTGTSRAGEASGAAPATSSSPAAPAASAGSPSAAWAAVMGGGHSYQWNLWRIRGTVIDFSRGFAGLAHRSSQEATPGGGGL